MCGRKVETDIEVVRKVWEPVDTRTRLADDGDRGLPVRDVVRLSRECAHAPFILEQPCHTMEEIATLRGRVPHPIVTREGCDTSAGTPRGVGPQTRRRHVSAATAPRHRCRIGGDFFPMTASKWGPPPEEMVWSVDRSPPARSRRAWG